MRRVLFLCSANYYRSRFAEILFNHLAQENDLDWIAESRGIVAQWSFNPGPIAEATQRGLAARSIPLHNVRYPLQLTESDLREAGHIVALHQDEHYPMMSSYFSDWADKIEYWRVPDLDELDAEQALAFIEENTRALVRNLQELKPGKDGQG